MNEKATWTKHDADELTAAEVVKDIRLREPADR